jgi:hypothetical protein
VKRLALVLVAGTAALAFAGPAHATVPTCEGTLAVNCYGERSCVVWVQVGATQLCGLPSQA